MTSPYDTDCQTIKIALDTAYASHNHTHNSGIAYGQVDSTSTATVFTATVEGITSLTDGTTVMLRNGIVTSAEGFTLEVNNLGAKPVYNSMADETRDTTIFNIAYTMLFIYDSTRVNGGCWICYRGYNSDKDTNTIGYQLRTNSTVFTTTDKGYRYRLWLETTDNKVMPVNLSTSTNATAKRNTAMNTRDFYLGGRIFYYSTKADTNANTELTATTMWQQYLVTLGYSFNNTGSALTLTLNAPVFMVAEARPNGMGRLASPYYTQTLPNTEDNLLYIYLGHATSATQIELALQHPIYEYKNSSIRLYRDTYTSSETDTLLNGKANSTHTHTVSNISDFPSTLTPSSHSHGNLQNDGSVGTTDNASKNVVTDSNGKITTEAKPTIPSASSTTPSADATNGAVGSGTTWARADHQHPFPSQLATSTISANTDLDTLTTDGIYIADASVVSSLTNAPFTSSNDGFVVEVRNGNDGSIQQTVYITSNSTEGTCNYYIRNYVGNAWIDWYGIPINRLLNGNVFHLGNTHSTSTSSAYYVNDYGVIKSLTQGTSIYILNTKADNSANATLKVSDFDAKPIYTNNTAIGSGEWKKNSVNLFVYTTFTSINSGNGAWIMFENMYIHPSAKQCNASIPSKTSDLTNDSNFISTSSTTGLVKNDGSIDTNTYLTQHQSLTNYIQKSNTSGLLKNDGTVDTSSYLTTGTASSTYVAKETGKGLFSGSYNDLTNKPSIPSSSSDLSDGSSLVKTSNTTGLIKNDGSIDTTSYSTFSGSYNDLSNKPTIPSAYVHPSEKQCNYAYTHPSEKQCSYAYTHPSTKQCNATIPSSITDLSLDSTYGYPFLTDNDDTIKALNDRLAYDSNSDKVFYDVDGSSSWYELATQNDISTLQSLIGNAITYINQ